MRHKSRTVTGFMINILMFVCIVSNSLAVSVKRLRESDTSVLTMDGGDNSQWLFVQVHTFISVVSTNFGCRICCAFHSSIVWFFDVRKLAIRSRILWLGDGWVESTVQSFESIKDTSLEFGHQCSCGWPIPYLSFISLKFWEKYFIFAELYFSQTQDYKSGFLS